MANANKSVFDSLKDDIQDDETAVIRDIEISNIRPYPFNRKVTSEDEDVILLASQLEEGNWELINEIDVVEDPNNESDYMLICGERRWTAFKLGGKSHIRAKVHELDEKQRRYMNLVENFQSKKEDAIQEAKRFSEFCTVFNVKQTEAAKIFGAAQTVFSMSVKYLSRVEDIPDVNEIYQNHSSDRLLLKALVQIYDKNPTALKSVIAFGKANKCLTRNYAKGAVFLNLFGDVEAQLRMWQADNFEGNPDIYDGKTLEEPGNTVALESIPTIDKKVSDDSDNGNTFDVPVTDEIAPENSSDDVSVEENTVSSDTVEKFGIKMRKRPITKAEISVVYNGNNYTLDLGHISENQDKVILRSISGDYVEAGLSDCELTSVL